MNSDRSTLDDQVCILTSWRSERKSHSWQKGPHDLSVSIPLPDLQHYVQYKGGHLSTEPKLWSFLDFYVSEKRPWLYKSWSSRAAGQWVIWYWTENSSSDPIACPCLAKTQQMWDIIEFPEPSRWPKRLVIDASGSSHVCLKFMLILKSLSLDRLSWS